MVLFTVALLAAACGVGGARHTGTADCSSRIKADGAVYESHGSTRHRAVEQGVAREADCEDVGAGARGSVFTEDSREVTTYRFPGYPPTQVLGVRYGEAKELAVFVADTVNGADRERIHRQLARPK